MKTETKKERFKRLATQRTGNVLKAIRVLGHCANTGAYEYDSKDVEVIFSAIEKQVRLTKSRFSSVSEEDIKFKL